jgi:hypothetical protein
VKPHDIGDSNRLSVRTLSGLGRMKHLVLILAALFAAVLILPVVGKGLLTLIFFRPIAPPPQPQFGFTGNWGATEVGGFTLRPLPPAAEVWQNYSASLTNFHGSRLYLARLGGASRQSGFRTWVSSGDTPAGAQRYTNVEFTYIDPTNGTYILNWSFRGEHDTRFLRFDDTLRRYHLEPCGTPGESPPRLSIVAIEGIRPEHHAGP